MKFVAMEQKRKNLNTLSADPSQLFVSILDLLLNLLFYLANH